MSQETITQQLVEKVISINRVAKVTKGGKKFSFGALVVVGNTQGLVGFGLGKSNEVAGAIRKAVSQATKNMFSAPMNEGTIPYQIICNYGATKVILKPASKGTGIIASGPIRAMCVAAGIKDIITKSLGSNNSINVIRAVVNGLKTIKSQEELSDEQPLIK